MFDSPVLKWIKKGKGLKNLITILSKKKKMAWIIRYKNVNKGSDPKFNKYFLNLASQW